MAKILLFITGSLDGYIARTDGSVDWLLGTDDGAEYEGFYARIGTTLMGYRTYQEILGFGVDFPYPDKTNYVFSRQRRHSDGNPVTFVREDPVRFVEALKGSAEDDVWLVGGGQLNSLLLNAGLVDEMLYYLQPITLGSGTPLFAEGAEEQKWTLYQQKVFPTGVVKLHYLNT